MTIPEEMITKILNYVATASDPGDILHRLHTLGAPAAPGALGMPDPGKMRNCVWALAPHFDDRATASADTMDFIIAAIGTAAANHDDAGEQVMFAAIGQEAWTVESDDFNADADRLKTEGRLSEHPDAVEVTLIYAASRDGRRWRARRYLTGPNADQPVTMDLLVGRPHPREFFGVPTAGPMLRMVGLLPQETKKSW